MRIHPQIELVDERGTPSVFAFFPYLKTKKAVRFRGLWLRSSDDSTGLNEQDATHLKCLSDMFFLQNDLRIKSVSYAHLRAGEPAGALHGFISILGEVRQLLAYLYSAPHSISGDPFLALEHADLYVFWPARVSKYLIWPDHHVERCEADGPRPESDDHGYLGGYEGVLNGNSYLWVARGCRIYPRASHMWLNISQDLSGLGPGCAASRRNRFVLDSLNAAPDVSPLDSTTTTALEWYCRSTSLDAGEDEAVADLAIAFESLLDLDPQERVRDRFKQAVLLLIGPTARLESWLEQFYKARSEIVHEGASENMMFRAVGRARAQTLQSAPRYRSLVSYGRQIFQACLGARLSGRRMSDELHLDSQMVTNRERLQRICQRLEEKADDPHAAILSVARDVVDISTYQFVQEEGLTISDLLGAARRMAKAYTEAGLEDSEEMLDGLRRLAACSFAEEDGRYRALDQIRKIIDGARAQRESAVVALEMDARSIVLGLLESVWRYTLMHYFHLQRSLSAKKGGA